MDEKQARFLLEDVKAIVRVLQMLAGKLWEYLEFLEEELNEEAEKGSQE